MDLVEGLRDGRFYALKRILCHDKEDRQAALHEVEMHGLFDHPNILRLVAHCMVEKGAKHEAWLLLPYVKVRGAPLAAPTLLPPRAAVVTSCLHFPGGDPLERGGSTERERDLHARAADPPHPSWHLPRAASHPQQRLRAQVGGWQPQWGGVGWQGAQQVLSDVHPCRDLKPTNVLLDEDDRPVLMDLGSMNQARIEVNSSRKAMAVQVGAQ